ncbi:MAG: MATE family efflux transporter [Lachnospiraceae bacterium]|nr:MATE family efflux transporter [Lachnospiraceae bacterium]
MKQKSLRKELIVLTWPIFVECVLFMLIGIIDVTMLSRYSDNATGAVGIVNSLINMFNIFFSIITAGTSIICVQHIGAGKPKLENQKLIGTSLIFNTFIGVIFSILIFFFHSPLLHFMNTEKEFWDYSRSYLLIVGSTIFLQAIMNTFTAALRSYSQTKSCMYVTVLVNLLNIMGNFCLIYGNFGLPRLGVTGAAISTVISKVIGTLILGFLCGKKVMEHFKPSYLKPFPFYHLKNVLKLGTPAGGESIAYNGAKLVITIILTYLGTAAVNANAYLNSISSVIYIFAVATGQGTAIIVGRLVGEKKEKEAYHLCFSSFFISLGITALASILVLLFHYPILRIFTSNSEIITLCRNALIVDLFLELGRCSNVVIINCLRAAGDVNFPVIMGIISMWGIGVVFSYVLGIQLRLGIVGVWIALAADEIFRGIIMFFRWKMCKWHNKAIV